MHVLTFDYQRSTGTGPPEFRGTRSDLRQLLRNEMIRVREHWPDCESYMNVK